MTRQTTATILVGRNEPDRPWGNPLVGRHLLTLTVNSGAAWTVHPLAPGSESFEPTAYVSKSPDNLLAQGLLAFLATAVPHALEESPDLARLLTTEGTDRRVTLAPAPRQAEAIAEVFGRYAQGAVTRLDTCCLTDEQIAMARKAGAPLLVASAVAGKEDA
jgi:hypothetical protein